MKISVKHSVSRPVDGRWFLLCLSALGWLLICAWMFHIANFRNSGDRTTQNETLAFPGDEGLPKLHLMNERHVELENAGSQASRDTARVLLASKPLVINVDVSGVTAQDRGAEIILDSESDKEFRAPILTLPSEPGSSTNDGLPNGLSASTSGVLEILSAQIGFNLNDASINQQLERVLDRMFEPMSLYLDAQVHIYIASNESRDAAINNLLSRGRGQAMVDYWVNRGLEVERFSIFVESGVDLPFSTHTVRVLSEGVNR